MFELQCRNCASVLLCNAVSKAPPIDIHAQKRYVDDDISQSALEDSSQ